MDDLLLQLFLEAHPRPPRGTVPGLDAAGDPIHGRRQEGRFLHGHCRPCCHLPLHACCGQHLLPHRPGVSSRDPGADVPGQAARLIAGTGKAWPRTRTVLRGGPGFCRNRTMGWCGDPAVAVDCAFGLSRSHRPERILEPEMTMARIGCPRTGRPARRHRDFRYRTLKSWPGTRRVVGRAGYLTGGASPRFVAASPDRAQVTATGLYGRKYRARGEMENRIREMEMALFSDRTSRQAMPASQLRVCFSGLACVLLSGTGRLAPEGADSGRMRCGTLRSRLLQVAAQLRITSRRIWITLPQSCPAAAQVAQIPATLQGLPRYRPQPGQTGCIPRPGRAGSLTEPYPACGNCGQDRPSVGSGAAKTASGGRFGPEKSAIGPKIGSIGKSVTDAG